MVPARDAAAVHRRHRRQRRRADCAIRLPGPGLRRDAEERLCQRRNVEPAAVGRVGRRVRHRPVQDRAVARTDRAPRRCRPARSRCAGIPQGAPALCGDHEPRRAAHRDLGHGQDRRQRRAGRARPVPQCPHRVREHPRRVLAGAHRRRSGRKALRRDARRRRRDHQRAHRAGGGADVGDAAVRAGRPPESLHHHERQACARFRAGDGLDRAHHRALVRDLGSRQHAQCSAGVLPVRQASQLGVQPDGDRSRLSEARRDHLRPRLYAAVV